MNGCENVILLDGEWEAGTDRVYNRVAYVPGLTCDPAVMDEGTLWYCREIVLPQGDWTHATLVLKGARFCPSVYVNSRLVSQSMGGMAPTMHLLADADIKPGSKLQLEISLKSLKDVDDTDASRTPEADRWRSNVSSCLWDSPVVRLHKGCRINRMIPYPDLANDRLSIRWELEDIDGVLAKGNLTIVFQVIDKDGGILREAFVENAGCTGFGTIVLNHSCIPWSPENPNCYRLRAVLKNGDGILDEDEITMGLKEFGVCYPGFVLNGRPVQLRGGSVVWHRWLRDPESGKLAYDEQWFERNVIQRLKSHGANMLRFHLGMPPEKLLDLCDRYGLLVQAEWSFFHGMKGSRDSLSEQWRSWLDLCMRHPSVAIIHAWNETREEELKTAKEALEALLPEYPPLVIGHRDVLHIHRYWWSIFENVGIYYDSAEQFDKPIMVDEFGGNYLDGEGMPGAYPTVKGSFLRFLGYDHTREMRLRLQGDACARIAEYWRRIGAAGFSPFCILGSPEDGNHHFLGKLAEGTPKPVWGALTAAYSPISCSIDVWDRNYTPGMKVSFPIYLFNDTGNTARLDIHASIKGSDNVIKTGESFTSVLAPHSTAKKDIIMQLPAEEGEWELGAMLENRPDTVKHPVISSWSIKTIESKAPEALKLKRIAVPEYEEELQSFFAGLGLGANVIDKGKTDVLVISKTGFEKVYREPEVKQSFEVLLGKGCSIVILDAGPASLGAEYPSDGGSVNMKSIFAEYYEREKSVVENELFFGMRAVFKEMPEPESCIHPTVSGGCLWEGLDRQATQLWNGLRGGLIVPAWDMELHGYGPDDFIAQWVNRGADADKIKTGRYFAYELSGFYAFSTGNNDRAVDELRAKVKFLREDAPALEDSVNPDGPVRCTDLSDLYRQSSCARYESIKPLVCCGNDLVRTPVLEVRFGRGYGKLILSQLITSGRLTDGFGQKGFYGIRKDPAAGQFVLNMIKQAVAL